MQTVAFQAKTQNGATEVPKEYLSQVGDIVRVILVTHTGKTSSNIIDQLLANPIDLENFEPLKRNEIHDRRQ